AEQRLVDLLDRWQASLERHARYLDLDDAAYAKIQDWPPHQRPTRWIVDVARARLQELRRQLGERQSRGDAAFADALELMAFLTTLLGSEHVERFIPYAAEVKSGTSQEASSRASTSTADDTRKQARAPVEPTVIRPRPARPAAVSPKPAKTEKAAKVDKPVKTEKPVASAKVTEMVIADAVRLLSWGREWPQLAGLIARLADRPPEPEVWAILRAHRSSIQSKSRRAPG
ncbi:MAG TPA: hypothetical protein PK163_05430, partial [Steroidobacteraceae bacterium]|nr:hypothetical protein [Steroidobacteraceae bacterium]